MLKVAMLSRWHVHADDCVKQFLDTGKAEIVAVWDEIPERGIAWAKELGVDFSPTLETVLARPDVQAVACNVPTTMHKEVFIAAAKAGKNIFTEKVLATTMSDGEEIAHAVKNAGIIFTISYFLRRDARMRYAKKLLDDGIFGRIGTIRMRRSHSGVSENWLVDYWFDTAKTGGGSMMDLGAHPMYLLSWLCGKPKRVSGVFNSFFHTPDENAVAVIEFENGVIGVAETSFVSYNTPDILEIYGTDATLMISGSEIKVATKKLSGVHGGYIVPDMIEPEPPSPIESFVDACLGLAPAPDDLDVDAGVAVSQLIELAYRSNESNTTVKA